MKNILLIAIGTVVLLCRGYCGVGNGSVLSTTKIQDNGPDNQRYNIVIMGDGYQNTETATFEAQALAVVNAFNAQAIFGECDDAVNFYRVNIESDDSGVDKPGPCYAPPILVDTYLDAEYCGDGSTDRCIGSTNTALIQTTASNATANWNFVVVLVNDTEHGGCRWGNITYSSTGANFERTVIHELGHAIGNLADEYEEFNSTYVGGEPTRANITIETNRNNLKWRDLVLATTLIPTWDKTDCAVFSNPPAAWNSIVGTYEGGNRQYTCDIYRPTPNCLMRATTNPFCAVCAKRLQQVLLSYYTNSNLYIAPWGYNNEPKTNPYWQSPDIWCDNDNDGIQEADEPAINKADNHLFARITNIGSAPSSPFQVEFSYVPYTGVIDMANRQIIDTIDRPVLNNGLSDEVECIWDLTSIPPAFSGIDHFCVIVRILGSECITYDNQAQNNFGNVPTVGPSPAPVNFYIKNIYDVQAKGRVIIEPVPSSWQYKSNVPDLNNIPLAGKEEKLITIKFIYNGDCAINNDKVVATGANRETTNLNHGLCAKQVFDISFELEGQILGGVSSQIEVKRKELKRSLSLHAGVTYPLSDLNKSYNPGMMLGIDADYHFSKNLALVGLLAYNQFIADSTDLDNTYIINASLNLKYYAGNSLIKPFINGGGGLYFPKDDPLKAGINVGAGVSRSLRSDLLVELSVDYHLLFDDTNTNFLVTHLGIIWLF